MSTHTQTAQVKGSFNQPDSLSPLNYVGFIGSIICPFASLAVLGFGIGATPTLLFLKIVAINLLALFLSKR